MAGMLLLGALGSRVSAQTDTLGIPGATARAARTHAADTSTNIPVAAPMAVPADIPVAPIAAPATPPVAAPIPTATIAPSVPPELSALARPAPVRLIHSSALPGWLIGQLLSLAAVGGFIAYYCGLTRAKNCGHTCTVLLLGVMFGLTGFWISGFAVQTGGLEDAHAALLVPVSATTLGGLDHELGFMMGGHHWGFMGSDGFFLNTDAETRNGTATLFLGQAILLALVVTVALGGALERSRLLAMAISAFLIGALIYPLFANWVWGGGWLAELGREFGLGHGLVDLAGAGVIHLTAGTLALVFTLELGPRYGRFGRNHAVTAIPGHNIPFVILGSAAILLSFTAINAVAYPGQAGEESAGGISAVNTLLGAAGGLLATFFYSFYKRHRPDPAGLCRGLIGGAVAAFVIGAVAAAAVQGTVEMLERRRIDDPVGVVAVHGAGGAWGLVAVGLFANSSSGAGINGVSGPVRSLFFGHDGLQLVAQILGCLVCFAVVFGLGYGCVTLMQKIVGIRVDVADETSGLDLPKLGVLGYQADAEVEKEP
jgi:Amt family ammonium transporter